MARKKTAMVAYEGRAKKLQWHRDRRGLRADGLRGRYYIFARKGRTDRRNGLFPWVVSCNDVDIGSKDRIDEVKRVAQKHDQEVNAVPSGGSQPASYRRRVHDCLVAMKSPDPLGDVEVSGSYIDRMEAAGIDPMTTASVVFATRHHGHFGGPKHSEFTAEESPTRGEWEVVVMGVPAQLRDTISAMAPAGASVIGSSMTLHGFYDDEKATAVAKRITHQYGLLTTNGPKRWAVAAEKPKAMEANDSAPSCQPFTKLVRDPARFSACMLKSKQIGPIENSRGIYDVVVDDLSKQDQECFVVLCIDFRGSVRDYVEVARGQRHRVAVDPEDVLRPVLLSGCDGFAVAHQHPSGVAEPSDADGDLTKRIRKAAEVACPNVKFLDHVVVGRGQFFSFTDKKLHKVK